MKAMVLALAIAMSLVLNSSMQAAHLPTLPSIPAASGVSASLPSVDADPASYDVRPVLFPAEMAGGSVSPQPILNDHGDIVYYVDHPVLRQGGVDIDLKKVILTYLKKSPQYLNAPPQSFNNFGQILVWYEYCNVFDPVTGCRVSSGYGKGWLLLTPRASGGSVYLPSTPQTR